MSQYAGSGQKSQQMAVFTGSSQLPNALVQSQITAGLATGVPPPWLQTGLRPENAIPVGFLRIYQTFLSYDGSYRI
jgi:hypothetical protein